MKQELKFFDFCAGIGGGRLGLTNSGLNCVAFSEIDKKAEETYKIFFGKDEINYGDLTKIDPFKLPDFDLLICGFPCQTFSIVGKREGFNDQRGLIIYSLVEILKVKKISYFILENVKGLTNHDNGKTFKTIIHLLKDSGYDLYYRVLNSINFGVLQMRERIYFIGIRKDIKKRDFVWPKAKESKSISYYLCDNDTQVLPINDKTFTNYLNNKYNKGIYNINDILLYDYLVLDTRQSDLRLYENKVPTLRSGRHGILYVKDKQLHKLSGYEGLLLQGFPKGIAEIAKKNKINSNTLLSQAGNAMTVSVINSLCEQLLECVED